MASIDLDIVKLYADVCSLVYIQCEVLAGEGYNHLVVPSRGASPIVDGAKSYFFTRRLPDAGSFAERLNLQKIFTCGPLCNPLYIPFTADIPATITGIESSNIRRFWARTIRAMVAGDNDLYLKFYNFNRKHVSRVGRGAFDERRLAGQKFVFIDTVVSGRAVSEIVDAFEECGLENYYLIAVVDSNGDKLQGSYRHKLLNLENEGKATILHVPHLFTEDKGPAMSGIWCVTFPDIMQAALRIVPEFRNSQAIGSGIYYHEVAARPDKSNLNITESNAMLSCMINTCFMSLPMPKVETLLEDATQRIADLRSKADSKIDDTLSAFLDEFAQHNKQHKLDERQTTVDVAIPRLRNDVVVKHSVESSSSHSLRALVCPESAEQIIKSFVESLRT